MILESVENGPLIWPTIEENRVTRPRKYSKLSVADAIQADNDVKATNIILQGLPPESHVAHDDLGSTRGSSSIVAAACSRLYKDNVDFLNKLMCSFLGHITNRQDIINDIPGIESGLHGEATKMLTRIG
ncbi:hypothetical protein Tco_0158299 [Tanacetum coccineum]